MTGLNDTDIRLTDAWELTRAADGDAPLCSGLDCLYQNIIQSEDGDLVRLEIAQRARLGLQRREVIVPESIEVEVSFSDDVFRLWCSFRFTDEESPRELNVVVSAVDVEVITV